MNSEKIAKDHLTKRGVASAKIEIIEVDCGEMEKLNQKHLGKSGPTDVLSFPLEPIPGEKENLIGTVVLCGDIIKEQSHKNGKTYQEEFEYLVRHGIDHLLGIHHK